MFRSFLVRGSSKLSYRQQISHVKTVDDSDVPGLLDLEVCENEEFSPDKLRATLERFYMTIVRPNLWFMPCNIPQDCFLRLLVSQHLASI